jgi:hypothetical protein
MPFFPVDDGLWGHPKADAAGDAALGLWTRAGSYCAKYTTEGTLTAAEVRKLGAKPSQVRALITAGLWHAPDHDCDRCPQPPPGGYQFHEWHKNGNRTREQVEADRAAAAERQRRFRQRKAPDDPPPDGTSRENQRRDNGSRNGVSHTTQARPGHITEPATQVPRQPQAAEPPAADPYSDQGTSQTLIAEWIDRGCAGQRPPGRVVGQVAREIGAMLAEGIPYEAVRAGLAAWHTRRLSPAVLASVVHEIRIGPATAGRPRASTTDQRVQAALDLADEFAAERAANVIPIREIGSA